MFRFPFTNFHELNLDWILSIVKRFSDLVEPMQSAVDDVNQAVETAQTALETATTASENAAQATTDAEHALELVEQAIIGIIPDNSVSTAKLTNGAVTTAKIADEAVTSDKIADDAITSDKIADDAITSDKIADEAVTIDKIDPQIIDDLHQYSNNRFKGKKALIIGDSWCAGWNGSATVTSWTDAFINLTGLIADIIQLSGGGFSVRGNGTYSNENFVEALEHVKTNEYDYVFVQDGVNDIGSNADFAIPMQSFINNCKTYFDCPVYLFFTVPFKFLSTAENNRAKSLIRNAVSMGYITCSKSYLLSFASNNYKGNDSSHCNEEGYRVLGGLLADFIESGDFNIVTDGIEINNTSSYLPDLSQNSATTDTSIARDLWVRWNGSSTFVYGKVRVTSSTQYGFITIFTGLPLGAVPFSNAGFAIDDASGKVMPMFVNNDALILMNNGLDLVNKYVTLSANYISGSY